MIIRKLREERGWSQEQLSELSDLSVRTIQRIEGGHKPSMETLRALAAAFDTDVASLTTQAADTASNALRSVEEDEAIAHVRNIKHFYRHLFTYLVVIGFLFVLDLISSPRSFWVQYPAMGWGIAVALQGLRTYGRLKFFGREWEQRQIKKFLERKS